MKKKYSIVIGIFYLLIVGLAFFLNIKPLLFFLTIPWSLIFAFFSPLIGHMFEYSSSSYVLIWGALLNLLIFFKLALFNANYSDLDDPE